MQAGKPVILRSMLPPLLLVGVAYVVCAADTLEAATWTTTRITDNSYPDYMPHVSGGNVVWYGYPHGMELKDTEIYLYDGANITQLTDNNYPDYEARVSGSNVVWQGFDGHDYEVFLYGGTDIAQLTDNSYEDYYPEISGSNVVWYGYDGNDYEIFLYDGTSVTQITDNSHFDHWCHVSGSNVVWEQRHDENDDYEIFLYDGTSIIQLTDNDYNDCYAEISGSQVVWHGDHGGADSEIFLATAGPPPQVTDPDPADQAEGVRITADLSWSPALGATSYDVYFGTSPPGAFQGNRTETSFDPGTMDPKTDYFWRIDSINDAGTTTGQVWQFTTGPIPGDFDADDDVDQEDFGHLQECLAGSGIAPEMLCEDADLDADGDVDAGDFGVFQGCMSGANIPASPDCVD